ncbi:LytR/AlgR family response regulator transcription factor [Streptomyces sp. MAR4 CNX-425]|uniref:LytR/AlgR family response regulator transcription factor n=1 Tax=Streptomyces sp. MAR4 CNX-425 TaxID=3406343 RepID=UPI003B509438
MLHTLAVDDEEPALVELAYLLRRDPRVAEVQTAGDGQQALLALDRALAAGRSVDAVFLDIGMPGLDGLALARLISRFAHPPRVVFVTAHEDHAVEAFALRAADYVLKPVAPERLAEAVRRCAESAAEPVPGEPPEAPGVREPPEPGAAPPERAAVPDEVISVELAGVTRFVQRREVLYAEAQGDYARLHTGGGSHLVRIPLATLEERWGAAGFVRIHRSHLVALHHVRELRMEAGRTYVVLGGHVLPVSRRHTRQVREMLVRHPPTAAVSG